MIAIHSRVMAILNPGKKQDYESLKYCALLRFSETVYTRRSMCRGLQVVYSRHERMVAIAQPTGGPTRIPML
jgi:hypothetical protein